MIRWICNIALAALGVGLFFALVQTLRGPRLADRIVGINLTGSLSTAVLAVLAVRLEQSWLLDVCIIYALLSFLAVAVLARLRISAEKRGGGESDG